jgi:tRNA C32,U32 (ribose-2'-O)-methylase TrmJ
VDVVIKLASLVITHDVTPSVVMILFFVHQQNKQSNQNKKEIEKLKKYNEKQQAEEKERQSKELERALERIKNHDKNNQKHLEGLLLELIKKKK